MTEADRAFQRYRAHRQPEDLAMVFDHCAPQLLLLANHVAGGSGAEDIVQMTFLRAIEAADRFEPGRPVQPWLVGILVREARKARRQDLRSPDHDRVGEKAGEPVPDEAAELREFQTALSSAIGELPQAYREVVGLRLVHGLTPTEIAHLRGVSAETVKTQLRRGTERLRRLLPVGFASALVALAATGGMLAAARDKVLEAATARLTAAGATGAAAVIAAGAAPGVATVAAGALRARRLAWTLAAGGAVTVGAFAYEAFGGDPTLPPAEHRVVLKPRTPEAAPMRAGVVEAAPPAAREPDLPLVTFTGRVVDTDSLGIEGLKVEILRLHADALVAPAARLPRQTGSPRLVTGTAVTDQIGRFTIPGVPPSGTLVLVLDAGGPRIDLRPIDRTPEPRERVELGELRLGPPLVVRGRLVDDRGEPVAGARLRASSDQWKSPPELGLAGPLLERICSDEFEPDAALVLRADERHTVLTMPEWFRGLYARLLGKTVTTDQQGCFAWVTSRPGPITLAANARGFAPQQFPFEVRLPEVDMGNLVLHMVGGAGGQVVDERGDPAPGAEVLFCQLERDATCMLAPVRATTDAEGRFHAPWDHRHELLVFVRRDARHPWQSAGVHVPDDRMVLALPRRFDVVVHVTHRRGAARTPIEGVPELRLVPGRLDPDCPVSCLTLHQLGCLEALDLDARRRDRKPGEIELREVPRGDWILMVSQPGYDTRVVHVRVDGAVHIPSIELTPLEPTTVTLADSGFGGLVDLPVYGRGAGPERGAFEFPVLIGRTDAEGVLRAAGDRWARRSFGTSSMELGQRSGFAGAGTDRVAIALPRRGVIEGVLTEGGELVTPGSWLLVARPSDDGKAPPPALPRSAVVCTTGEQGRFRFPPLEPGRWDVDIMRRREWIDHPSQLLPVMFRRATDAPRQQKVEVVARGRERLHIEATPPEEPEPEERPAAPETLRGSVHIGQAQFGPLHVGVEQGGRWTWVGVDPAGAFDTGVRLSGTTRVAVLGGAHERVEAGSPEQYLWLGTVSCEGGMAFDLEVPVHLMTFTLTTPRRRHAAGLDVVLEGTLRPAPGTAPARCRLRAQTDGSGWFRIDLPAGDYALRTEHAEMGWLEARVQVAFGHSKSFRLAALVAAEGHALPAEIGFELPRGSKVRFAREGGSLVREAEFPARLTLVGRPPRPFRVAGLLPGRYRVTLHASAVSRGLVIPPEKTGITADQGVVEVGPGGLRDLVLRRPAPKK